MIGRFSCGAGCSVTAHLLVNKLIYFMQRHDAVPAAHAAGHLAVAAARLREEVEALLAAIVLDVIAAMKSRSRGG
jgi:hypothetical protein